MHSTIKVVVTSVDGEMSGPVLRLVPSRQENMRTPCGGGNDLAICVLVCFCRSDWLTADAPFSPTPEALATVVIL